MLVVENKNSLIRNDLKFKNQIEVKYYDQLKWLLQNRSIKSFEVRPSFQLWAEGEYEFPFQYTPDFKVVNLDSSVDVIDLKNMEWEDFVKIKRELKERFSCNLSCITYDEKYKWIDREKLSKWRDL
ncbi:MULTISPECIES: DUF1064 domain-containing protein [Bacillus]|uniref:DUF1064 domain-containing protein n=1 Tax=Bacillus glycinifermentans TaxID=1664069 RepID=A0A0T6BN43_9BACI|nr:MULTISPECIES: DUF1064 domain-containing protein [Bacillus]KRT93079.1 hypothetical protein AB447_203865 [Bacillus glycinifermentans]MEC0341940.1 DUF1064 domain-containing protein [Bacillus sonorensis]MEC0457375.1 DUF1064 domain-containing protein [Bacillus sonorensis]MEC0487890.1 DUF1064 domain-containing protein [Bacillus glycinifermentans]MEC0530659.1 DUF1064 domain-containing protein [Bacillus sonorensis]